jgi:hypothetical protein
VLVLAAVLRVVGLHWGLPDKFHLFSYHPDEFHSLRGALALLLAGDPNPHFFNYGSLYLYLVSIAAALADSSSTGLGSGESVAQLLRDWTLAARYLNVLCALLTVLVVALTGQRLLGGRQGLVAGLAVAVMPLHVMHSHYATVDVPQALFISLALYFAVRLAQQPTWRNYLLAGLMAGLAASVKYNGAVVIVAPLVAHLLADRTGTKAVRLYSPAPLVMLVMMAGAFALTSPYTFLDWENARRDILYEVSHMRVGEEPARSADPSGALFHALGLTITTAGATLAALWGLGVALGRKHARVAAGVVIFGALWAAMISLANVRYGRYEVGLVPVVALLLAAAPLAFRTRRSELRLPGFLLTVLPLALGLLVSGQVVWRLQTLPDPRDDALQQIRRVVPPDRPVGLVWEPWFQSPPLDPCNGGQVLRANPVWRQFSQPVRPLAIIGLSAEELTRQQPLAFVYSNFEIRDHLRTGSAEAQALVSHLRTEYAPLAVAQRPAPLAGFLGWQPPQDWLYAFPELHAYLRVVP